MSKWFIRLRYLWLATALAITGALGASVLFTGVASAHSSYVSSNPAAGTVVATAPTQVSVSFAENLNPQGANGIPSSLTVYHLTDAKNTYSFDEEAKPVSPDKGTQFPLSDPKSMTITMQGDGNGIYAVVWHTVSSDDGDPDSGVFFFGVGSGNVLGGAAAPASTPTTTTTPASASSGTPIWLTILVGIVALVLGGGLGVGLSQRRRGASAPGGGAGVPTPPDTTSSTTPKNR